MLVTHSVNKTIQNYDFKLLFNVKLIYSTQVLRPWLWGNGPFFSSVMRQRKGPSGENAPPVHGIKKCLAVSYDAVSNSSRMRFCMVMESVAQLLMW